MTTYLYLSVAFLVGMGATALSAMWAAIPSVICSFIGLLACAGVLVLLKVA